jgi:ABC-type transporter Mla subunit MlaD
VETQIQIPKNAKVTIDTMGLMGEVRRHPDARQDATETIKPGEEFEAIDPVRMTRLMSEGDEILKKVNKSIDAMNQILSDPKFIDSVKNSAFRFEDTMASVNLTARNFDHRLDEVQGRFERFLDRLDDATTGIVDLMDEAREGLVETVDNVRSITRDLKELSLTNRAVVDRAIKDFSETAAAMKRLVSDVEAGGTTAADFRKLFENLRETTDRIRQIFEDGKMGDDLKGAVGRLRSVLEKARPLPRRRQGNGRRAVGQARLHLALQPRPRVDEQRPQPRRQPRPEGAPDGRARHRARLGTRLHPRRRPAALHARREAALRHHQVEDGRRVRLLAHEELAHHGRRDRHPEHEDRLDLALPDRRRDVAAHPRGGRPSADREANLGVRGTSARTPRRPEGDP